MIAAVGLFGVHHSLNVHGYAALSPLNLILQARQYTQRASCCASCIVKPREKEKKEKKEKKKRRGKLRDGSEALALLEPLYWIGKRTRQTDRSPKVVAADVTSTREAVEQ